MTAGQLPEHGLVIGKFMPPHKGHDFLLNEAFNHSGGSLTVMVMARYDDPIPGELRLAWLKAQHPGKHIVLVKHSLPIGEDTDDNWKNYIALIMKNLDRPVTTLYSSEAYLIEGAKRLGIKNHVVDESRAAVPVSATQIRNDFETNRQYISDDVYQWMKANWKKPAPPAPKSPAP